MTRRPEMPRGIIYQERDELRDMLQRVYDAEFGFGGWPDDKEIKTLLDKTDRGE